jgi:hypothetical protein
MGSKMLHIYRAFSLERPWWQEGIELFNPFFTRRWIVINQNPQKEKSVIKQAIESSRLALSLCLF